MRNRAVVLFVVCGKEVSFVGWKLNCLREGSTIRVRAKI